MNIVRNWNRASSRRFVTRAPLQARKLLQRLPLATARNPEACPHG